ncbi:hypothetical protein acdb102_36450 [Acidothermaceae bacterium B102]|nr:hypothetical protein acdb102_36450 [Acidothermaceae bacterium B102]
MTTHCEPPRLNDSSDWMFGEAMATIVWSMNVMATAKSIAVSATYRALVVKVTDTSFAIETILCGHG